MSIARGFVRLSGATRQNTSFVVDKLICRVKRRPHPEPTQWKCSFAGGAEPGFAFGFGHGWQMHL